VTPTDQNSLDSPTDLEFGPGQIGTEVPQAFVAELRRRGGHFPVHTLYAVLCHFCGIEHDPWRVGELTWMSTANPSAPGEPPQPDSDHRFGVEHGGHLHRGLVYAAHRRGTNLSEAFAAGMVAYIEDDSALPLVFRGVYVYGNEELEVLHLAHATRPNGTLEPEAALVVCHPVGHLSGGQPADVRAIPLDVFLGKAEGAADYLYIGTPEA
jgi:hypothetical protein